MMPETPQSKRRGGNLPKRLKGFVDDMKNFKAFGIHRHHRGVKSEHVQTKSNWAVESPVILSAAGQACQGGQAGSVPDQVPAVPPAHQSQPLFRAGAPNPMTNLTVQVALNFHEPLNYSYSRDYDASPALQPTDHLCEGLLRRIDHCSQELITRRDSSALDRTSGDGTAKPLRYEIHVHVVRDQTETWSSRTFRSYQRQSLDPESAKEIILSAHHMVGLFFRKHDEAFVWKDGPVRDQLSQEQETFAYRPGRVQPLTCVPRSYFLEKSQNFESIPGYTITLSFTSRNSRRKPVEWHQIVEVTSIQPSPLNLGTAESLFFDASYLLETTLRAERKEFEKNHHACIPTDGCKQCRKRDGDGIEMKLSLANNLGPSFEHLERTIRVETALFSHPEARDCVDFIGKMRLGLNDARDASDDIVSHLNDLEFKITELRGRGWALDEPLLFTIDYTNSYSRRSTEAILDRIQTGVADILKSNANMVRMTAYKRGHFVLDKTLISKEPFETTRGKRRSPQKSRAYVLDRLCQRVDQDIAIMCRDTCSIDDLTDDHVTSETVNHNLLRQESSGSTTPTPAMEQESPAATLGDTASVERPIYNGREASQESPVSEASGSGRSESVVDESSQSTPPALGRRWTTSVRDPETGARSFPLMPEQDDEKEPQSTFIDNYSSQETEQRHELGMRTIATANKRPLEELRPRTAPNCNTYLANHQRTLSEGCPVGEGYSALEDQDRSFDSSTAPQTPSLIFGGNTSPRSSILVTPKVYGSMYSADMDMFKDSAADSDEDVGERHVKVASDGQRKFLQSVPEMSPTRRKHVRTMTRSPLHQDQASEESPGLGISNPAFDVKGQVEEEEQGACSVAKDSPPEVGPHNTAQDGIPDKLMLPDGSDSVNELPVDSDFSTTEKGGEIVIPMQHEADNITATTQLEPLGTIEANTEEEHTEAEPEFSQSRLDFDFSSPAAITPMEGSENSNFEDNRSPISEGTNMENSTGDADTPAEATSPDPSEDFDLPLSPRGRLPLQSHRKSFGSAGYLGFQGNRFGRMDLRSALLGGATSPRSPSQDRGFFGEIETEDRPGTAA
ncbi:hypothetical protein F5Y15DRAFT_364866 [Xylariaceae sp. FL0016]|nr:hypothetical protein F5Y15DRAFT_364866 [Xylariaceae sp. FL0016]